MPPQRARPLTVSVIQQNNRTRDPCTVLFETSTIDHIRQVHRKTQKDIADKQEELRCGFGVPQNSSRLSECSVHQEAGGGLSEGNPDCLPLASSPRSASFCRQLVGGSYRELLGSADVIMGMRGDADAAVDGLRRVREGFAALVRAGDAPPTASRQTEEASKDRELRNALYGVGCRVKFLVDTPEVIWGCLDESQFAASAERFLSALDVHAVLTTDAAATKHLSSFSVLRSQWPLVGTFRGVIAKRARERLGDTRLTAPDVASALAALAALEGDSTASALSTFLESRRGALNASLAAAVADGSSSASAALVRAVQLLQSAVCNAGELFLETNGAFRLPFVSFPFCSPQAASCLTTDAGDAFDRGPRCRLAAYMPRSFPADVRFTASPFRRREAPPCRRPHRSPYGGGAGLRNSQPAPRGRAVEAEARGARAEARAAAGECSQ